MNCQNVACTRDGRRHVLPGQDTSCYSSGDTVTAGGRHFKLGAAHREHYGTNDASLCVSWEAEEVGKPASYLTRGRD